MAVFIKKVNIPQKSDLINIDMTGSGTAQTYRVLKNVSGSVVEVIAMENSSNSQAFASSGQIYENSALDTHLNTTWYETLSNDAKSAIVDKTFRQMSWLNEVVTSSSVTGYIGVNSRNQKYKYTLVNSSLGNEITRHVYALDLQDVIDYLDATPEMTADNTTLTYTNLWQMFNNQATEPTTNTAHWFCSAYSQNSNQAFFMNSVGYFANNFASNTFGARPAFQIDLSKIDYTFTDGRQPVELKPVSILQKSNNALSRVGMSCKEPPIDLTGTTWLFNNSLTIPAGVGMFNLTYTTTGTPYHTSWTNMLIGYNTSDVATSDFLVYQDGGYKSAVYLIAYGGWVDNTYKTITITGGTDATNQDLVAWLQANATQQ